MGDYWGCELVFDGGGLFGGDFRVGGGFGSGWISSCGCVCVAVWVTGCVLVDRFAGFGR